MSKDNPIFHNTLMHRVASTIASICFLNSKFNSMRKIKNVYEVLGRRSSLSAVFNKAGDSSSWTERFINVLASYTTMDPPVSNATTHTVSSAEQLCVRPLMNNQRPSCCCTYEINLLRRVHRVMLLQGNQCLSCCIPPLDTQYAHLLS